MTKISNNDSDNTLNPQDMNIKSLILTIESVPVLLDSDVAMLFGYETRDLNKAATRNIERFPSEFRFQLTAEKIEEILKPQTATLSSDDNLMFQIGTSRLENHFQKQTHGGRRKRPYVYTEHGIIMLAGILRNKTAVEVSINITKAFVEMRRFLNTNRDVFAKMVSIDNKLLEHDRKFDEVFDLLQQPEAFKQNIFFKGQFYDAFTLVIGLIEKAMISITIIDNYVDDSVLDMLTHKKAGVTVTIITVNPNRLSSHFLNKFTAQYGGIKIVASKDFHDRFVILDCTEVYTFGASLKDLGSKCFEVSKSEDSARFISYIQGII